MSGVRLSLLQTPILALSGLLATFLASTHLIHYVLVSRSVRGPLGPIRAPTRRLLTFQHRFDDTVTVRFPSITLTAASLEFSPPAETPPADAHSDFPLSRQNLTYMIYNQLDWIQYNT